MADKGPQNALTKVLFQCSQCPYRTDRRNNLSRHITTMHTKMKSEMKCCGIVVHSKWDLKHHNRTVHSDGYVCNLCNRIFQRKDLRDRHLSVHTGEKKFKCDTCSYGSSHKSNLERHWRVHREHNGYFTEVPEVMNSSTHLDAITGRLPHSARLQYSPCQPSSYLWSVEEGHQLRHSENYKISPPCAHDQDTQKSPAPAKQTYYHLALLPQEDNAGHRLSNLDTSILWSSHGSFFPTCAPPTVQWPVSPSAQHFLYSNWNPVDPLPRPFTIISPDIKSSLRQTEAYQYEETTERSSEEPKVASPEECLPWSKTEINLQRELEAPPEASQDHQYDLPAYTPSTVVRPTPLRHRYNLYPLDLIVFRRRASRESPHGQPGIVYHCRSRLSSSQYNSAPHITTGIPPCCSYAVRTSPLQDAGT